MQTNFLAAVKQIAAEKGIELSIVVDAIKESLRSSFKEYADETGALLEIDIEPEKGEIAVYADKKVTKEVTNPATQITLADAQKLEPKLKVGDHLLVEITHTGDFGRVAAQAARQVIMQKLREAEKEAIIQQFVDKIGQVESAIVQRIDPEGNVFCEIYRAVAKMPPAEQIHTEHYRSGDRIKVFLKKIHTDARGKILIVSRADPSFLKALFEMEVPEIASGTVEIMAIAREAGSRSKVAVKSNSEGVDPQGACIGQRGARINAITNELKFGPVEEKVDIILWSDDPATFIANAIKPAEAMNVRIVSVEERQAVIIVDDEYLSLAIGRDGQNVRLAAKLTGWYLDIQGKNMYAENKQLSKFERDTKAAAASKSKNVKPTKTAKTKKARKASQTDALAGLGLPTRVCSALVKAGIDTKVKLAAEIKKGNKIPGIGDKSLDEIKAALK